ncbi:MAG: flavin reductase family protein [Rhizobiales bacterium]|nr:flavin reductase family protein [Hyphomicrobiales bacterium]
MFYDATENAHGLPHDPFKALIAPRPIGWISTLAADGVANLAPYSFFNGIASDPPLVMFSSAMRKDSQRNAEETGEFVCNLATWDLREAINMSSAMVGPEVDEFALSGLEMTPSRLVKPPRVKASPVHLECVYVETVKLKNRKGEKHPFYEMIIGEVVGIHIDDRFIKEGIVDIAAMKPISRLGYHDYAVTDDLFSMRRPK